jgi:hypothetical protein
VAACCCNTRERLVRGGIKGRPAWWLLIHCRVPSNVRQMMYHSPICRAVSAIWGHSWTGVQWVSVPKFEHHHNDMLGHLQEFETSSCFWGSVASSGTYRCLTHLLLPHPSTPPMQECMLDEDPTQLATVPLPAGVALNVSHAPG